jgi:AcrR family transcriptional regulator
MSTAEGAPGRQDGGLKRKLVEATTELLLEPREVRLPTMREIATRAGVSPGAAYRHFDTQHQLLLAVIAHLFAELEEFLAQSVGREADAAGAGTDAADADAARSIRLMAHAYVAWGLANAGGYQLLFETTDDAELLTHEERPGRHLLAPLAVLLARHAHSQIPLAEEATRLWVSLHGLVSLRTHKTGMIWPASVEADVDQLLDLFLAPTRP